MFMSIMYVWCVEQCPAPFQQCLQLPSLKQIDRQYLFVNFLQEGASLIYRPYTKAD